MTEFHLIFKLSPLLMGLLSGGGVTQIFSDLEEKTKQYFKLEIVYFAEGLNFKIQR